MKAVVIGPGRIGCGFAGHVLRESGFDVVFLARNRVMADHLNRVGRYQVCLCDGRSASMATVDGIRAVWLSDRDRAVAEIAEADVVITAVGAGALPELAPRIAAGLGARSTAANVIAFENMRQASERLRALVMRQLPEEWWSVRHGFSGGLVERVVSKRLGDPSEDEPLVFVGDSCSTLRVDRRGLVEPFPAIRGMIAADQFEAWVERKLYTYSAGHAAAAYLGHLKGYRYVHTAIRDPEIRGAVLQAMREGQRGLAARYGREISGGEGLLRKILHRFENAALADPIERVGRDPCRKLGVDERLVGAARLAAQAGIAPRNLALAAAAALCFFEPADPSAPAMRSEIDRVGTGEIIQRVCGLRPDRGLGKLVSDDCGSLLNGHDSNSLLLKLRPYLWS